MPTLIPITEQPTATCILTRTSLVTAEVRTTNAVTGTFHIWMAVEMVE